MTRKRLSGIILQLLFLSSLSVIGSAHAAASENNPRLSVKVAVLANFPPQYALNNRARPTGFAVDVMNQVAGLANLAPDYVVFQSWPDAQEALRSGTVDIIPNMGITKRRQAFADFTSPVETFPVSIFVRKAESGINAAQDLSGHKVVVVEVNVGYTLLKDRRDIELVIAHNPSEAIMFLLSGQVDALVFPHPVIDQLARKSGIDDKLKVAGKPLKEVVRGIAVRKGRDDLLGRLDAAVQRFVKTEAYHRIYVRWHGGPATYWTKRRVFTALGLGLTVFIVGMSVMRYITLSRFSKTLEKRVQERTAALAASEENFRLLFENASFGIAVHDLVFDERHTPVNYVLTNMNPAFYKILGFDPGSGTGCLATEFYGVPEAPFLEQYAAVALGGQPMDKEVDFAPMGKIFKVSAYSHRHQSFVTVFEDITMRKHTETQLRNVTHKLELAQELGRSGWWEYDVINEKATWPDVSYALFGHDSADTTFDYKRFQQLIHPEYRDYYDTQLKKLLDTGIAEFLYPITRADGQTRWIWARGEAEYDESGNPVRLFGMLQDITDRKKIEDALTASEWRFRALIEASAQIVWSCDPQGYMSEDSPSWREYTGQSYEQWRGYGYADAIHPEDREAVIDQWHEGLKQGTPITNEYRLIHKSGQWRWCQARAVPIKDDAGQILSWVGMNSDIHDRREAENALRESETKFHQAMIHAPIGKAIVSPDGRWIDVNPSLCRIVGYTREELLATDFQSMTHPDDLETDLEYVGQLLSGERSTYQLEKRYIHKDGHAVWIQLNVALVRDDDQKPRYFIGQIQDITVRRENELQLRKSQRRFQEIIDASPMPLSLSNDHGKILYTNPAFVDTLGYTLEDIPTIDDFWPKGYPEPAYREEVIQKWWQRVTQSEKDLTPFVPMEVRICCKDGSTRTMLATSTLLSGFTEKTRLVTLYDITQNKIMSERLKTLLSTASDGIHVMDEKGNVVEFSDSFARMLGYTVEETARLNVADWEAQIPRDALEPTIKELFKTSSTFETKHRRKDGSIFDAEINAKGIVLDGRILLYASSRDISERKKAEKDLLYYEKIVSTIEALIALVDRDMVYLQVNDALARMIGRKREQIIGRPIQQIVNADIYSKLEPQLKKSLAGKTVSQEIWVPSPDGRKQLYQIIRYPMVDENGKVYAVAEVGHNMTEIYQANQALTKVNAELEQANESLKLAKRIAESANKAKSIFLSNMSHELRTPLNAILGYTQILTADKSFGAKQQSGIQTIHQAGEHLLMIINDVLDMSKIEAGKLQLVPSKIQLLPFFENIIEFFKYRAREKGLRVTFETDQSLDFAIKADELRLRQVIFNLLSNAIKFTYKGYCRLYVEATDCKESICQLKITVEDSGIGIPKEQQGEVFEPFKQVGERLQYKEGSGLGLAISKKLVNLMGGELLLTSPVNPSPTDGEGAGSRFSFTIDTQRVQADRAGYIEKSRKQVVGYKHRGKTNEPVKVLIVDDKLSNRAVLRDTLKPLGFATQEATDGSMVTKICLKTRPDLILMDLRMPNVDGFSAMDQLKHHDALIDIPVVAITASIAESETLEKRCIQHGFKGFILKPFVTLDLLESIARLLPITLIYQETDEQEPADFSTIEIPSDELVAKLSKLLSKGDIDGILDHAEAIGGLENGKYQDYSQLIRTLANDFKFSELERLISSKENADD